MLSWNLSDPDDRSELQGYMTSGIWVEGIEACSVERGVIFTLRYKDSGGTEIYSESNKATVVMMNLGNAVYREANPEGVKERGHGAIVFAFTGDMSRTSLLDCSKYTVAQVSGQHPNTNEDLTYQTDPESGREFWFCYGNAGTPNSTAGYVARLKVLKVAKWLADAGNAIDFVIYSVIDGRGFSWDGSLSDVANLRCDGFIELCYEFNGVDAWGKIVNGAAQYDIYTYIVDHNDWIYGDDPNQLGDSAYASLNPCTQGGWVDDYIDEHYQSYTGPNFRGTFWQTKFDRQRLVFPTILSPESATEH